MARHLQHDKVISAIIDDLKARRDILNFHDVTIATYNKKIVDAQDRIARRQAMIYNLKRVWKITLAALDQADEVDEQLIAQFNQGLLNTAESAFTQIANAACRIATRAGERTELRRSIKRDFKSLGLANEHDISMSRRIRMSVEKLETEYHKNMAWVTKMKKIY